MGIESAEMGNLIGNCYNRGGTVEILREVKSVPVMITHGEYEVLWQIPIFE